MAEWVLATSAGPFRLAPIYYVDEADDAYVVVDVGLWPEPSE